MRAALLEAAGVPTEVSGLTQLMSGGSGLLRPQMLTPPTGEHVRPVTGQRPAIARPVDVPAAVPVDVETADTLPPPARADASVPVPLVSPGRRGETPLRTPLPATPNAWDSIPPQPAPRSKAPWLLLVLALVVAAAVAVAELSPGTLGLSAAPFGLFAQSPAGGEASASADDAGVADAGPSDAGVPMIEVRLVGVPDDATVVLDDVTYVGASLAAARVDGVVVLPVRRRRGAFDVEVTAPGRERWRARRWGLRDWEWTVQLDVIDAGPPDAGVTVGVDAPGGPAVSEPTKRPTKVRRPRRRRHR